MKQTAAALIAFLAPCAYAQWTVVNLHPAGATRSEAFGVQGGQQVGYAVVGGVWRPVLWTGTAGSWLDLTPAGAAPWIGTGAYGVGGGQQVGLVGVAGAERASFWTGTAGSWVDLTPVGATASSARGVDSGQQVGNAVVGGVRRASLWTGSAGSWGDLHPVGATWSTAYGLGGGQQVGFVEIGGSDRRASLWTGSAGSWVNLHPGGWTASLALGVGGGQQVGYVAAGGVSRASLWTGSAASWVDLTPAGATSAYALGVHEGQQVGQATATGVNRASVWCGTAGSWVDLHLFLPVDFTSSGASGIGHDGAVTFVVGGGSNGVTNRTEALMWVSRAVAPTSYSMFRGTVFSGNLASLINSDGNKLVLRPGVVLQSSEPPVQIRINSTAPSANPNGISFSVESSASFAFAQQKISLWNYDTGTYELLDTRVVTTSDDTVTVTVRTNAHRFIDNGTLAMRALVSYKAVGPSILYPWSGRIDRVWWSFPG